MARSSIGVRTSSGSSAAAAWELIANTGVGCTVLGIHVTLAAATASTYGLGRPAAIGITPTTPVAVLPENTASPALVTAPKVAVAWGTGPTIPTAFFRRVSFPATITSNILWEFQDGLWVPAGGSLILWNLAANGVVDVTVVTK